MSEYYHYTSMAFAKLIIRDGMYRDSHAYTLNQYFDPNSAGQAVGVMPHNVECVLLFKDDGMYKPYKPPIVSAAGRFTGGATQFVHPMRPKPSGIRKINERTWQKV